MWDDQHFGLPPAACGVALGRTHQNDGFEKVSDHLGMYACRGWCVALRRGAGEGVLQ